MGVFYSCIRGGFLSKNLIKAIVILLFLQPRRDARAVEWGGLENRCSCKRTQGSNPCLSAFFILICSCNRTQGSTIGTPLEESLSLRFFILICSCNRTQGPAIGTPLEESLSLRFFYFQCLKYYIVSIFLFI